MLDVPQVQLLEIAQRFGTPVYAYDAGRVRRQVARLRAALPPVELLYSLKANPSLCGLLAECGLGADVSSSGELAAAVAAGCPPQRIVVSGPYKSPATLRLLGSLPAATVSVDSIGELELLAGLDRPLRAMLRLRPDFDSSALVPTGAASRFGIPVEELKACDELLVAGKVEVVGFHVFVGSQVLDAAAVVGHLRGALDLALHAAEVLSLSPEIFNLGGGFGIAYEPGDAELDLGVVGAALQSIVDQAAPARIALELGRYLVAEAGWYLTSVAAIGHAPAGEQAVVVDGGIHQRFDLCGLQLRHRGVAPAVLTEPADDRTVTTTVLGCLCLPDDVLAQGVRLPPLTPGTVLAFPNSGAYGLTASPLAFISHPVPPEVRFEDGQFELVPPPVPL